MKLPHVYWIGGSPCAGKTTIAALIGQEFDWQVIHIDRHVERYMQQANSQQHPYLTQYRQDGVRRFLSLDLEAQIAGVKGISAEQFEFILQDIAALPADTPILVEGANILAEHVAAVIPSIHHAIWMTPTEEFQLWAYPNRGQWVQDVLRYHFAEDVRVDVFDRWMQRDIQIALWTAEQARRFTIPVLLVDGIASVAENAEHVMQHFGLLTDTESST